MKRIGFASKLGRYFLLFLMALAALQPQAARSQVIINEVLANNDTILPLLDVLDYTPDYVELYNAGTNDVDLGLEGWSLSVEQDKATNFFSVGTIIAADSYLLIFCDKNTNVAGYHSFFSLDTHGDTLTLRRGAVTNEVLRYGLQVPDYAIGRVPGANTNIPFTLIHPSPCGGTIPCATNTEALFVGPPTGSNFLSLKINEWVALDTAGNGRDTNDWFEVYNPSNSIMSLSGLVFADGGSVALIGNPLALPAVRPLSYIAPLGFVQIFANGGKDADEVDFSLSSTSGDQIFIYAADRATQIDRVTFGPQRAANISRGRIPDGEELQIELPSSTPRESNFGRIDEILITEVLTHTDLPLEDAVEFQNVSSTNVNMGGWWLSNQRDNPKKFRIPAGTIVTPGRFLVLYETQFNGPAADQPFTFNSANGDECWLFKAKADGSLTGFRRGISFGPAPNGVSFERHVTSDGNVEITASSALSLGTSVTATDPPSYLGIFRSGQGASNPPPRVGPLVINEIHYHPPPSISGTNLLDDSLNEFVEIFNSSEDLVRLYDPGIYVADRDWNDLPDGSSLRQGEIYADGRTNTWRIRGGVDYEFPAELLTIPSKGFVIVVNFDPVTNLDQVEIFRSKFPNLPGNARLFGPYRGKLANSTADVDLRRPDPPQGPQHPDFRLVPYITIDHVAYQDKPPWAPTPDGEGDSLQRKSAYEYGSDSTNWKAGLPTPGQFNSDTGEEPPSIVTHPRAKTARVGSTVTFSVVARGSALSYQWELNSVPIPQALSATLQRVNVSTSLAGDYRVIVANAAGSVTSQVAHLTIQTQIDTTRPTVAVVSPTPTTRLTNEATIARGTARDNVGLEVVEYSLNNASFVAATGSPNWAVWGTQFPLQLNPGTNYLRARSSDYAGNISVTNVRPIYFALPRPVGLSVSGAGVVTGATDQQPLELGRNYVVTATPAPNNLFSNWVVSTNLVLAYSSAASKLTFQMHSNLSIVASFVPNPFLSVRGTYNGLFHEAECSRNESSGAFKLTLTDKGKYSGTLQVGTKRYPVSGTLDLTGLATNRVTVSPGHQLAVLWALDLHGTEQISGTVSDGVWTANLLGNRAQTYTLASPAPHLGRFTWIIAGTPGTNGLPEGDGHGTAVIDKANVVTFSGNLAEGTPVTQKVPVSKYGTWPLYVPLHSGRGSIVSWVSLDTNAPPSGLSGALCWVRPAQTSLKYYTNGFVFPTWIVGSRYTVPVGVNSPVLNLNNAVVVLSGGQLSETYTNVVTIAPNNRVTNASPHRLTVTFKPPTGLFTGSFQAAGTSRIVNFKGAVLQNYTNASGYFLGTNQSGRVSIEALQAP